MTIIEVAEELNADLSDDAMIYQGSATWEQWQCHVPRAVVDEWESLDKRARAAVFLTAHAVTF